MSDEHPADMLARLGSNGLLWAQEFNKIAVRLGYSEMDEGWLIGWFANAIENSCNPLRNEVDALRAELAAERERNRWSTAEVATAQAYQANQRADKAEAERDALRAWVNTIAAQKLEGEMEDDDERENADYQGAYNKIVEGSRSLVSVRIDTMVKGDGE